MSRDERARGGLPGGTAGHETIGLTTSAIAWWIEQQRRQDPDRRRVVLVPDSEAAGTVREALSFFSGLSSAEILQMVEPSERPYATLNPDSVWERESATALARIAEDLPWSILVATPPAMMRLVPSPSAYRRKVLLIAPEVQLSRERIVEFLEDGGYTERDAVEEVGSYVVRGGLVEVFSPFYDDPIRIDLFGDTVESVHAFNPATLARKHPVDVAVVPPVSVLLMDAEARRGALERLGAWMEDDGAEREHRFDEIVTALSINARPPGYLNYLDELCPKGLSPLETYLPQDAAWTVLEHHRVAGMFTGFGAELRASYEAAVTSGAFASPPEKLFRAWDPGADLPGGSAEVHLFSSAESDPLRFEARALAIEGFGSLKPRVDAARKSRRPEMSEVVTAVHDALVKKKRRVAFVTESMSRAKQFKKAMNAAGMRCEIERGQHRGKELPEHLVVRAGRLPESVVDLRAGVAWLSDHDVYGRAATRLASASAPTRERVNQALSQFKPTDLVVHDAYGIGRYRGVVRQRSDGIEADFVQVDYRDGDRVLLPVTSVDRLQRYVSGKGAIALDRLGSNAFERRKAKVRKALERIADDLVRMYAARKIARGTAYDVDGDADLAAFELAFGHDLTKDQSLVIAEIFKDLADDRPMDRLLCGDVGYGKTEMALRAAFVVLSAARQVAVLVPTTVLAEQHCQTFERRLGPFGFKVRGLTRFRSKREQRALLEEAAKGQIDVVIGTHRLLQSDVHFRDLGFLVVDEEHRFGVRHKERIKALKAELDVLSMTATPIPRSLEMSLTGIRDLSVIATAPLGRQAVETVVTRFNTDLIRDVIERELGRGGKVFFVHNRVESILRVRELIERLVPSARIVVGHGQMSSGDLEEVMLRFVKGDANLLLSTTIVESGLDIPVANTMIINQAHRLGLSELYQLRGRVGRSDSQAHAILLIPGDNVLTPLARKRLRSIQKHSGLGAGFQLAMEDLEMRGAGNLLGEAQSGHVEAVGYNLYMSMLEETIASKQGGAAAPGIVDTRVKVPLPAFLPAEWFPEERHRVALYRRLAGCRDFDELRVLEDELGRRDGDTPAPVVTLLDVTRLRINARSLGISEIIVNKRRVLVRFAEGEGYEALWQRVVASIARGELAFLPSAARELRKDLPVTKDSGLMRAARLALKPLWACARSPDA